MRDGLFYKGSCVLCAPPFMFLVLGESGPESGGPGVPVWAGVCLPLSNPSPSQYKVELSGWGLIHSHLDLTQESHQGFQGKRGLKREVWMYQSNWLRCGTGVRFPPWKCMEDWRTGWQPRCSLPHPAYTQQHTIRIRTADSWNHLGENESCGLGTIDTGRGSWPRSPSPEAIGAFLPPTPSASSLGERGRGKFPGPSLWPKLLFDLCLPSVSRIMIPWSKVKPRDRQWASCPGAWQPSPVLVEGFLSPNLSFPDPLPQPHPPWHLPVPASQIPGVCFLPLILGTSPSRKPGVLVIHP